MKFEEILPHLRNGKTARYPRYDIGGVDAYWSAGFVSLPSWHDENGKEIESEKVLTLHKVNKEGKPLRGKNDWGITNWAMMCDKWEIEK